METLINPLLPLITVRLLRWFESLCVLLIEAPTRLQYDGRHTCIRRRTRRLYTVTLSTKKRGGLMTKLIDRIAKWKAWTGWWPSLNQSHKDARQKRVEWWGENQRVRWCASRQHHHHHHRNDQQQQRHRVNQYIIYIASVSQPTILFFLLGENYFDVILFLGKVDR